MKTTTKYLTTLAALLLSAACVSCAAPASAAETCVPAPPPAPATVGGPTTVFTENFDHGLSQWNSVQTHYYNGSASSYGFKGYSLKIVNDGAGHESALRTEVRNGDTALGKHERAEVSGYGKPGLLANSGDELWYEFDVKFGDASVPWVTPKDWTIIAQWHAKDASGAPPVALSVHSDNKVYFEMEADDVVRPFIPVWDVRPGQWEHIVVHIGWSPDPTKGFVQTFVNGEEKLVRTPQQTMYSGDTRDTYMKIGTYRRYSNTATSVVLHDNLRISGA